MMEPLCSGMPAILLEFKVFRPAKEKSLADTVAAALDQIEQKRYGEELLARGIQKQDIRCYGFAFRGKEVLIGKRAVNL